MTSTSPATLETRLANLFIGDLMAPRGLKGLHQDAEVVFDPTHVDAYASIEVVREPAPSVSDAAKTFKFRRPTPDDCVATRKFTRTREPIDADTVPFARYSAPYELIDIQPANEASVVVVARASDGQASKARVVRFVRHQTSNLPLPAPRPSGSLDVAWFAASDDAIAGLDDAAPAPAPVRPIVVASVISLLLGALGLGVGVAFWAI